jgi:hypothetical protein
MQISTNNDIVHCLLRLGTAAFLSPKQCSKNELKTTEMCVKYHLKKLQSIYELTEIGKTTSDLLFNVLQIQKDCCSINDLQQQPPVFKAQIKMAKNDQELVNTGNKNPDSLEYNECIGKRSISSVVNEFREFEKIKNNILIYGLNSMSLQSGENNCDDGKVNFILNIAGMTRDAIQSQIRMDTRKGLDLVKITFKSFDLKKKLMKSKPIINMQPECNLKIYICEDRTSNERLYRAIQLQARDKLNASLEYIDNKNRRYGMFEGKRFYYVLKDGLLKIHSRY